MTEKEKQQRIGMYAPSGTYYEPMLKLLEKIRPLGDEAFLKGTQIMEQYIATLTLEKTGELDTLESIKKQADLTDALIGLHQSLVNQSNKEELVQIEFISIYG